MASRKRTVEHPKVPRVRSADGAKGAKKEKKTRTKRVPVQQENLSPEAGVPPEQLARLGTLLPAANEVIQSIEDRIVALTVAATSRWVPGQNAHDVDENAPVVFGDDEYADFLEMVEDISSAAMFQKLAAFFDIPETVVNQVLTSTLSAEMTPGPANKTQVGVVSHKRHGDPR